MPIGAILGAAGVGTALIGTSAAKSAANTQAQAANQAAQYQLQAAREAMALQLGMFDTIRGDFGPYRAVGDAAIPGYLAMLGITPRSAAGAGGGSAPAASPARQAPMRAGDINWTRLLEERPDVLAEYNRLEASADKNSPWYAQHGLGQGPEGFAQWWNSNRPAADAYTAPTWTQEEIDKLYPQTPAGGDGTGGTPTAGGGFDYANIQDYLENLPGYKFVRDQGIKGVTNAMSAKGLAGISGPMAKGIARFVTGLADQTYGSQLDRIAGAVGTGQNAAAQTGSFGSSAAQGASQSLLGGAQAVGQGITGAANAAAAGQIGSANAWGGALSNLGNAALTSRILGMYGG